MKEYKNVTFQKEIGYGFFPSHRAKEVLQVVFYISDWLNVLFFQILVCFAQVLNQITGYSTIPNIYKYEDFYN